MNRRTFNRTLLASASAASFPFVPEARLGTIGIQLYTVRDLFARDPEGTLTKLALAGYREVEFAGYNKMPAKVLRAILGRAGLTAPSAHVDTNTIRSGWAAALDYAKEVGHRYLVLAYLDRAERLSLDSYKRIADVLNGAAAEAKKVGIEVAYHNHDFEFFPLGGQVPYDVLLAATDRNLVKLELDLYWVSKAAGDPLSYFAKYPGRFPLIHVKDMDKGATQHMVELGAGRIDFKRIFAKGAGAGVKHYYVEHDNPADPIDFARKAAIYLKRLEY